MKKNCLFLLLSVLLVGTAQGVRLTGRAVARWAPEQVLTRVKVWVARQTPVTFESDQTRAEVMRKILEAGGDPELLLQLAGPGLKGFEWLQEPLEKARTLDPAGRKKLKRVIIAALEKIEKGEDIGKVAEELGGAVEEIEEEKEEPELKIEEKKEEEEDWPEFEEGPDLPPPPGLEELTEIKKTEKKKKVVAPEARDLVKEPPTEKEKIISDNLFRDVLQKIAVKLPKRPTKVDKITGEDTYTERALFGEYLKSIKKEFFKMLRLKKTFLKRAEFDEVFGSKGKEGEFQKLAKQEMQEIVADKDENAFLEKLYADFTDEHKLLEKFLNMLKPLVFNVDLLKSKTGVDLLRDYVMTMLINLAVGLRAPKYTAEEEKKGKVKGVELSDEIADNVIDNFKGLRGRFKGIRDPITQLVREIDFLRINKNFLRFDKLLGQKALEEAAGPKELSFRPLLFVLRSQEKILSRTFIARMGAQLFFKQNPEEFRKFLEKDRFFTKKFKNFEALQEQAIPKVDPQQFLVEKLAEVTNMEGLLKSLKALSKHKGADKKAIKAIELAIQKGEKEPEEILQDLKALMGINIEKSIPQERELKGILIRNQKLALFHRPIAKMLEKLGEDSADVRKPLRVGKRLYQELMKIAEMKLKNLGQEKPKDMSEFLLHQKLMRMAHRLRERTEAVLKSPVRTGLMVYELLREFFSEEELNDLKRVSKNFIAMWTEPYGLLTGAMAEISVNPRVRKKLGKLEDVFLDRAYRGEAGLADEVLKTVLDSAVLGASGVYDVSPVKDFVYDAYLAIRGRDPAAFRKMIQKIVAEAGLNVEKKGRFLEIVQGMIDLMLPEAFSGLVKQLSALNEGQGNIITQEGEKELIIPGMELAGIARKLIKFHKKVFAIMKGKFTTLLTLLGNDVTLLQKIDGKLLEKEVSEFYRKIDHDINKIDVKDLELEDPAQEKQKVKKAIKKFLQNILSKIGGLRVELKWPQKIKALKIYDKLLALNKGLGIADGESIIPSLPLEGVSEGKIDLHRTAYSSMRSLFTNLGKKIFKRGLHAKGINSREFSAELRKVLPEIQKRIEDPIRKRRDLAEERRFLSENRKYLIKEKERLASEGGTVEDRRDNERALAANERESLDNKREMLEVDEKERIFKDIKNFLFSLEKKVKAFGKK